MRLLSVFVTMILAAQTLLAAETKPTAVSPAEAKEGFKSLFDGKTLEGWQGAVKGYAAENGVLVCKKEGGGNLFTAKEYADFVLRFEFKLEAGGNNGLAVRAPLEGVSSYTGMEIQILDDAAAEYHNKNFELAPYQYHGSIYGVVPAKHGALKPVGQWNQEEVIAKGGHIKVTVNGKVVVDANLDKIKPPYVDHLEHPGLHNKKGYLGFLGHGSRVEFRNLRVKEL
jgi:hypothetical protein